MVPLRIARLKSSAYLYALAGIILSQLLIPSGSLSAQSLDPIELGVFRPVSHALISFDWKAFIQQDMRITQSEYREYVHRMDRVGLYPGVSKIKIPVYAPAKEGLSGALKTMPVVMTQDGARWEYCVEDELSKVWPVYNNLDEDASFAFSYAVTGRIRADSTTIESRYTQVRFSYILIGTAVQKWAGDVQARREQNRRRIVSDEQLGLDVISFELNNLPFVLIATQFRCISRNGEEQCGTISDSLLDQFIQSLRLVGGLPPKEHELSKMEAVLELDLKDEAIAFNDGGGREQGLGFVNESAIRYFRPGMLFEKSRKGSEDFHVYEKGFGQAAPRLYALKDHRELEALLGAGKSSESFDKGPWRDSFCASGKQQEERCKDGLGYIWQDLFNSNCHIIPWQVIVGNNYVFDFPELVVSATPNGGVLIGTRSSVSEGSCIYARVMMIVSDGRAHGFRVVPSYSSFIWSAMH